MDWGKLMTVEFWVDEHRQPHEGFKSLGVKIVIDVIC